MVGLGPHYSQIESIGMTTDFEKKYAFITAVGDRIGLVLDDNYWDYMLKAHEEDYGYQTEYKKFSKYIDDVWSGDVKSYRKELYKIRNTLVDLAWYFRKNDFGIRGKDCNKDLKEFVLSGTSEDRTMLHGHYYLSIDLKNADFQVVDYLNLLHGETINDYIRKTSEHTEIMEYKGNRNRTWDYMEKIMGHSKLYIWELYCLSKIYESDHEIMQYIRDNNLKLRKINGDELIFEIGEDMNLPQDFIDKWCKHDVGIEGLTCHVKALRYGLAHYTINGQEQYKSFYDNHVTGQRKYVTKNCIYIHQLDKIYRGKKLTEKDNAIKNGQGFKKFSDKIIILEN